MTPPDHLSRARNEAALRELIRVAIERGCVSLDLDKHDVTTIRSVIASLRNVAQVYQGALEQALDGDVDPKLGDGDWLSKREEDSPQERGRQHAAAAVDAFLGKAGR